MKRLVFAATALLLMFAAAPTARADEIDDALSMFSADDGLTAAEKIPALKALIEAHKGHPNVGKLTAILNDLAAEAGVKIETSAGEATDTGGPGAVLATNVLQTIEATDERKSNSDPSNEVLQTIATADDDDYVAVLDDENDSTPDVRDEDEKHSIYSLEDAQAAADAAATEALKNGTNPWMPPEEALKEADEAFKRIGPIPPVPKETRARITLPEECVADDFLNNGTVLGAIINLRERMRFALGSMSEKDEKEFDRHFNKALEFPSENIIAWCTNALPIVSEITRLRVALVNEAASFDEKLDEMNMARMVGNYEAAHGLMCSLSRTVANMKAIEAGMKQLMPKFEALGEMPDPVEERKKAANEYAEAKATIKEYFTFGDDVQDGTIEGQWEPYERYTEYTWYSTNRTDGTEGSWELNKRTGGGFLGASLFDQKRLTIKPVTQFGTNGLMYVYVYGEGFKASRRFTDAEGEKTRGESDSKDFWFEPEGDGVFARYRGWEDGDADRYALKAAKDNDGRDVLLYCEHTTAFADDDENDKKAANRVVKHTYKTTAFRRTGDCPLILPMSDENADGTKTGRTVEEKKKTAEKAYREAAGEFETAKEAFHKFAEGSPFLDAPAPYEMYYVLEDCAMTEKPCGRYDGDTQIVVVKLPERDDNRPLDARKGFLYRQDMERLDPERTDSDEQSGGVLEISPIRDDENEKPRARQKKHTRGYVASTRHDSDFAHGGSSGVQRGPFGEYEWADHGNKNCLDQACDYKVYFTARSGRRIDLDFAEASFLLKWLYPTTVLRPFDGQPCVIDFMPKVALKTCRIEDEMKPSECMLKASFGREKQYSSGIPSFNGLFGKDDSNLQMGYTNESFVAGTDAVVKFSVDMGFSMPVTKDVFFATRPVLGGYAGSEKKVCYRYKLMWMDIRRAREIANSLDAKFREDAIAAWKSEVPDALELARKNDDSTAGNQGNEKEKAKEETKEFHRNNIKWLDESIVRLQKQLGEAKTPGERRSLQVAIAGAQADKIHEEDMIRAVETGEFHASRTPWDDLTFAKFHEDVVREVQEISDAEKSRKIAEEMASKLSAKHEAAVRERIDKIVDEDPLNPEKWDKLREQIKDTRMYELENDPSRKAAFERANRLDTIVTGLEYTKAACEVAVSIGCGGAEWGAAKVIGCVYMATTGYIEGGVGNAFKKTVTFAYDSVQVASDFIDGCVEGGLVEGLKRGEISFALNYGVPFLLDKMKGPPDGTGCHNAFDLEKLSKWNPKAATRKPRIADINAEYFETKYSKKLIEGFKEKKAALDGLNALTKTHKVDTKTIVKVKKEYYNSLGKVNECPMAKAQLKYNKKYLNDGTSKQFAECCDRWQNAVKKKAMINMQVKRGYNKQKILNFRNEASTGTVGMDLDIGLDETPNTTVLRGGNEVQEFQITRNGQQVTKYQWAADMQEEVNGLVKLSTGCDARRQSVNVTHSGHPEAFKRVELLKNSKNEEYMRSIFAHSRPSEVEQAFDVSRFKADEMAHVKGHPEIMGRYEQFRGWAKDYDNIYGPALRGEVKALKAERIRLSKFGRDLPKRDIVKCERLEKTLKKYDKIYNVCKRVGDLETPIYMANTELQRITDKEIPELITDLSTTFKALNIGEAKNQRGLMVVQPKNTATKSRPKALPAPKQPKALPAPEKEPVKLLPWFGEKKD